MKRRDFVKTSCQICLLSSAGLLLTFMNSCSPAAGNSIFKTEVKNNQIEVPLSLFDKSPLQFVRPKGWNYDIAVEKNKDGYLALLMQCTHQSNQLISTVNGFTCNLHGSVFDKEGNVRKGPAEDPLKKFKTTISQNSLIINV